MTPEDILLRKLKETYIMYGSIVVGVDFDNTIYPLDPSFAKSCAEVVIKLNTM